MSQESEFLSLKKQKIEKTEVLLPKTKIETEDIRKIHPSSLPPSFFPQYPIPQQFPIDNQSTYDNFLKQIKDSNNNNFQYFPNNNNNDFNKHIRNFFEIFSAFQLSPFFNYNYDKFLCNQGFLFGNIFLFFSFKIFLRANEKY